MNYNEIIIVEGHHDMMKIKQALPKADVIVTNGQEISSTTLDLIIKASLTKEIILFLDPDGPGEKIRGIISAKVPQAKHAFISKNKCLSSNKKKVGIEHATKEDILDALDNLLTPVDNFSDLTFNDLFELGVVGKNNSKEIRNKISQYFNIGLPNAKTLLKRLNMFGIKKEDIKRLFQE